MTSFQFPTEGIIQKPRKKSSIIFISFCCDFYVHTAVVRSAGDFGIYRFFPPRRIRGFQSAETSSAEITGAMFSPRTRFPARFTPTRLHPSRNFCRNRLNIWKTPYGSWIFRPPPRPPDSWHRLPRSTFSERARPEAWPSFFISVWGASANRCI